MPRARPSPPGWRLACGRRPPATPGRRSGSGRGSKQTRRRGPAAGASPSRRCSLSAAPRRCPRSLSPPGASRARPWPRRLDHQQWQVVRRRLLGRHPCGQRAESQRRRDSHLPAEHRPDRVGSTSGPSLVSGTVLSWADELGRPPADGSGRQPELQPTRPAVIEHPGEHQGRPALPVRPAVRCTCPR